jgi:hypothetical protein
MAVGRQLHCVCSSYMSHIHFVVVVIELRLQLACVSCDAVAQSSSLVVYVPLPVWYATCTSCCCALTLNCTVPLLLLLLLILLLQQDSIDPTLLLTLLQSPEAVYSGYYLANVNTFMRLQGPQVVLDAIMGDPMLPPDVVAHLVDTIHNVSTAHYTMNRSVLHFIAYVSLTVAHRFDKLYRTLKNLVELSVAALQHAVYS